MSRPGSEAAGRVRARDDVLGYLLKHAHLALEHRAQATLADIGVTVRDLGVLRVIASGEAQSQQEAAAVLGVDRISMVALLDALERQGIVARRPSEQDRRRNIIAVTDHGWEVYRQAEGRYSETERDFTATLGDAGAAGLRQRAESLPFPHGQTWESRLQCLVSGPDWRVTAAWTHPGKTSTR
jgi:DNA-binding MarR family transcriptional regulator